MSLVVTKSMVSSSDSLVSVSMPTIISLALSARPDDELQVLPGDADRSPAQPAVDMVPGSALDVAALGRAGRGLVAGAQQLPVVGARRESRGCAVSYTHLTLPTKRIV